MESNNDLFTASLETIDSSKSVAKYNRFYDDFKRECEVTLDNARDWLKAEIPIVADKIDLSTLKDELKKNKTSETRKHLLSALIFEYATRDAIKSHNANSATLMAMHMLNHMWLAKLEINEHIPVLDSDQAYANLSEAEKQTSLQREKILDTLLKKGEKLQSESQIQDKNISKPNNNSKTRPKAVSKAKPSKHPLLEKKEKDLWDETSKERKKKRNNALEKKVKSKRKPKGVFSKVRDRIPRKKKAQNDLLNNAVRKSTAHERDEESLLENPNNSAIIVSSGIIKNMDDSVLKDSTTDGSDPNSSGITVRKVLKRREHETHEPGSNTIVMKLASGVSRKSKENLTIPEQCQEAVNIFCQQFPGYDMVAIKNLAAQKVGVSIQYIDNLNILPENNS